MAAVMIGVDPAKRSHAMAVLDERENQLAALQVGNDSAGYRDMVRLARRWPERTWAVEGAAGVGVQLAQRLVADGETVLDVPPKLSTRARIFDVGHGRKNDPGDARTVAVVAIRTKGLRQVVPDDEMVALRLMSERRRDLVRSRTQTVNHLHQLLMELIAAGAQRNLTAKKAKALLATVRPRDVAGRDPPAARGRPDRGPGRAGPQAQGVGQATQGRGRCDRDDPDRHQRRRDRDRGDDPRRGRGRAPVPVPAPLRHLHRGRPDRGVLRRGRNATGCPGPGTASSTTPCTSSRCPTSAATHAAAPTTRRSSPPAKARRAPCAA